jgi:hypothetical protein
LAALLGARRNIVIPRQLSPLHPATVIDDGQRRRAGIGQQPDARRAGVERIGDDLSENGLLERAGVGVTKVFEEMLKVDARFTHGNILSVDEPSLRSDAVPRRSFEDLVSKLGQILEDFRRRHDYRLQRPSRRLHFVKSHVLFVLVQEVL